MTYIEKLKEYEEEMIETLQELVAIPSVLGEPQEDMPFGEQVHRAYRYMMDKAASDGFDTQNIDNCGGHLEFGGHIYNETGETIAVSPEIMGILGHLDVVPAGEDWDGDPFSGEIREGRMYGRGTSDDKGPVVAAYYAMKAIRDAGYEPQKKVRLILGLDEETGWSGMRTYLEKAGAVDFGFTPDADFPVIHGELGMLIFEIAKKIGKTSGKGLELRSLTGGNAPNMVPDSATAVVRGESYDGLREKLAEFKRRTGYEISAKGRGRSLEIHAEGKSAHGSTPWQGVNGISVLMSFLGETGEFVNEDVQDVIRFYNEHLGFDTDGSRFGCHLSDELSRLALNVGMVKIDEEAARFVINIRYPLSSTQEQVYSGIKSVIEPYNMGIIKIKDMNPLHVPTDSSLVKTLMEVYQRHTGDTESKPLVIGGGTYAKAIPNTVAYGMLFPGEEDSMHQRNESVSLESLKLAAKIYADAIAELTQAKKIR